MTLDLRVDLLGRRRWPLPGLLLAALGLLAVGWQGARSLEATRQLALHRSGLAALERAGQVRPRATMSREDIQRHDQMMAVARHLALPWDGLLGAFERQAQAGIVLTRLRPDATTGRIEFTARAPGAEAAGRYLMALRAEPLLQQVQVLRHDLPGEVPGAGLELTLVAQWGTAASASTPVAPVAPAAASAPATASPRTAAVPPPAEFRRPS